jgi:hypothetical protein
MDKKDEKGDKEEGCCGSGCGCGRHCCGGKAALVLVLLLIGGLIGYAIGHCHSGRWAHCPYSGAPMSAPQETPTK